MSLKSLKSKELIATLKLMFSNRVFDKYIHYAVFPNYKNLVPGARINFDFPLTVLVGQNGTGKSSILHALYGMPKGESTGRFWFSTNLDAIDEGGELGAHRYFYGHQFENQIVETRKARVTKKDRGSDYWEPTKAAVSDGMIPFVPVEDKENGRSKTRWDPVNRKVTLLNFKAELSAYDKYMYFGRDPQSETLKTKQDRVRKDAKVIKKIIDNNIQNLTYHGLHSLAENRLLTGAELNAISYILEKDYDEARVVRHRFFGGNSKDDGLSVIFRNKTGLSYSEAHAGSGEVAVVSAVTQILSAPQSSLILLDEPEVSLHPGAQQRLMLFLMNQIKVHKHQIIMSTHSSEIIRDLPKEAVKLVQQIPAGKFHILENVSPAVAFAAIGTPNMERLRIYVEDTMAKMVVKRALSKLSESEANLVEIVPQPGGAEAILGRAIPLLMEQHQSKVLVFLDGDKRPPQLPPRSNTIRPVDYGSLEQIIFETVNCHPQWFLNGNGGVGDSSQKIDLQKKYIDWYLDNVKFLPFSCPEEIILRALSARNSVDIPNELNSAQAKDLLMESLGVEDADIDKAHEVVTMAKIPYKIALDNCASVAQIIGIIRPLLEGLR